MKFGNKLRYIAGGALLVGCAYMSHLGDKRVEAANQRMADFDQEVEMLKEQGLLKPGDIPKIAGKYNLITIHANFDNPGPLGTEMREYLPTGERCEYEIDEIYISDGENWVPEN